MPEEHRARAFFCDDSGLSGKTWEMLPALSQAALGFLLRHCSQQRETPSQSQRVWQRLRPWNNVKTKLQWVVAGKPPQALEQPTMYSCPTVRVGAGKNPFHFFSFPIRVAPAISSLEKPGGWAAHSPGSGEYKWKLHGNPQRVQDTAAGTKLFQVQKQNLDPSQGPRMAPGEGHWQATSPEPHTLRTLDFSPKMGGEREKSEFETYSNASHPSPELAPL